MECDVYIHKSNSTYLLDLDVSRAELLTQLFSHGLQRTRTNLVLGGVDISFRRAIMPLQAYDTRTCVLTWDEKWIYLLSYHVRPGAVVEDGERWAEALLGSGALAESKRNLVFAVSISKYVAKAGRRTVPPAELIKAGGFLDATDSEWVETVEARRIHGLGLLQGKCP